MPYGDRTGPEGRGPMSGGGFGLCAGFSQPGRFQSGFGRSHGRGARRRNRFLAAEWGNRITPEAPRLQQDRRVALEDELSELRRQVGAIQNQLNELYHKA